MTTKKPKAVHLTAHEKALIVAISEYAVFDDGEKYHRMGGAGPVDVPYSTLESLKTHKLIKQGDDHCWTLTPAGKKKAA